ncbi:MAG: PilZ domain-containing protein [Deltaproteobacteria bacterium]|nr:PilZ domain-containing protein [Deltaproteobacteria bacterium]
MTGNGEAKTGSPEVTVRLKRLLENLCEFIEYVPEDEQRKLLALLEQWKHPERRKRKRRPCAIPVDFVADGRALTGVIRNISPRGVQVASLEEIEEGQSVTLTFSFPGLTKPLKTSGRVTWSRGGRFGVDIEMPTRYLEEYIRKTIKDF